MDKKLGVLIAVIVVVLLLVLALNVRIRQQEKEKITLPVIEQDVPSQEMKIKEDTRALIQEESEDTEEIFSGPLLN